MQKIIIHRGSQTIGGSCVEIRSGNCRLLFDLGTPFMEKGGGELNPLALKAPSVGNDILPNIAGLYKHDKPSIDAIFISHAHIDHCGLLNYIHPDIPVYVSRGTKSLIEIGRVFYPPQSKIFFDNFKIFNHWEPLSIKPFKITSYLMDHSGYDASSFLIEGGNKKTFYSGDFRGHGRKSVLFERLLKQPVSGVDCLLMEGTTLGGKHHLGFENENDVKQALLKVFNLQKDVSFVMAAGSNVDRLVSLYKAARKSNKILVIDLYTFYLLSQLKEITPGLPPHDGDNIRIFYIRGHAQNIVDHLDKSILYKFKNRKIEIDEIVNHRQNVVLKLPIGAMRKISGYLLQEKPLAASKFIFSMWQGYLDRDNSFSDFCSEFELELLQIHVSGHAYLKQLQQFANALKPNKLVPIHTLAGEDYKNHFDNVFIYDDQVPFEV